MQPTSRDSGFTLVELLIVIVILGVLSSVVVFAVGGITNRGDEVATATDSNTIEAALEAYKALHGGYADEAELVSAGLLHDQSTVHDITLAADRSSYTIVAAGTGPTTTVAATTTTVPAATTTTTTVPAGPAPVTYHGFAGEAIGSGPKTLVIIGSGSGMSATLWSNLQASPFADTQVIWLNSGDVDSTDDVDAIIATNPTYMVAAQAVQIVNSASPSNNTYVGAYMATFLAWPADFWWMQNQGVPSIPALEAQLA